ncbi:MAG: peptidoglycan-binding protein [Bdellovibrionales bacterium]|nr:peptidoglycan-binding protein [Bdellovibrionales bacterium]
MTEKLKKGSSGSEVEGLQTRLRELGYYGGNIDGQFGPITERGVLLFQKAQRLKKDGIVGQKFGRPLTLRKVLRTIRALRSVREITLRLNPFSVILFLLAGPRPISHFVKLRRL